MTTAESFTPEELKTLAGSVMLSGMAVSMVDMGVVSTAIEANAMAQEVAGATQKYPSNAVIQALFSEEAVKQARSNGTMKLDVKPEEMQPNLAVDTAVTKINEALVILNQKATPEETQEFKEFIYSAADRVANAAGNGLFGSGGSKVSDKEAAALAKLKAALGL
ncbi:hypothetical protein C7B61_16385 [filamentous cyanobacterium CCP1]|nr:hypothetical protein C7B76_06435 [filamentous cyanobacterium CCP2]PSB61130.1 hypothetical protein C7B61_16385 [filamentous cyanobacterium CCP1]